MEDNPSYFLSDGDKIRSKPRAGSNYNSSRDSKRVSGFRRWIRQNRKKIAVSGCLLFVTLLILFIILFFSLRSAPKKRHCRKFFEAEIIIVRFECRLWKVYKNVLQSGQNNLMDGNPIQENERCHCTALSTFWSWWNKHFSYLNSVLTKFRLEENSDCDLKNFPINKETNFTCFKDSKVCTTVVLSVKTRTGSKELAFLTSSRGFVIVLIDESEQHKSRKPKRDFQKRSLVDEENESDIIYKIRDFFRHLDNCVGDFRIHYMKPSDYNTGLSKKDIGRVEKTFLPYSENKHCVVLPELVNEEITADGLSEASKQLKIFAQIPNDTFKKIPLSNNSYDIVNGVPNEDFARYYEKLLRKETSKNQSIIINALRKLSLNNETAIKYRMCLNLWMSDCFPSRERKTFVVTIYNPSEHRRNIFVRLPISLGEYSVSTFQGENLPAQMKKLPSAIANLKSRNILSGIDFSLLRELVFRAKEVPGYGFKSFFVSGIGPVKSIHENREDKIELILNPSTQKLTEVKIDGKTFFLESNLILYESNYCGGTLSRFKVFEKGKEYGTPVKKGEILTEYEYIYEGLGTKIIRVYAGENYLEVEWIFQNLAFFGEIAIQYNTSIDNQGIFYTGEDTEYRERKNHRLKCSQTCLPDENCTIKYYPTQEILMKDSSFQIFIFTETFQSVTSPCSGTIELSTLLKPKKDSIMSQKHWIFIGKTDDKAFQHRIQNFVMKNKVNPLLFFSNPTLFPKAFENWRDKFITEYTSLYADLPENVSIITFEPIKENVVWLRMKNIGESPTTVIKLENLFPKFEIEPRQSHLGTDFCSSGSRHHQSDLCNKNFDSQLGIGPLTKDVTLQPFEIKSFLLVMKPKQQPNILS